MVRHPFEATRRRPLPISVSTRGIALSHTLHRVIRGSVSAAIGRFSRRVRGVFVWVEDLNGPKSGRGMRCRMDIRLKQGGRLTVSAEATNEYAAVGRAANRARVRLVHRIQKARSNRRAASAATIAC
jgi:putative sigma-54 modulation protein